MKQLRIDTPKVFLGLMVFVMLLPLIATFMNSVASEWSGTVLPSGLTGQYYASVLADPRFHAALLRSVAVAAVALALATAIIVPAVVAAHIYWPALDRWMARLVILPYAIPAIVLMVGYLRIFSAPPLQIGGTPLVLVLTYVPLCFPMFYIGVKNSLRSLDIADMLNAGRLLGASDLAILRRVVLPCILPGVTIAIVLNFAGLISEFVYAKMLVGGNFETLQMYMFAQRSLSGRISSVIVVLYFMLILAITLIAFWLLTKTERRP
ncbi:ABC transporter permease [Phyllobacterium phragmitis]|uniref:ABC transporter permease n=1 Tax=Phyllobacterium phragmitis TaxID=2670329 RepID=A0A2S9IPX7_9HYPH|nr:ABC transporter permease subunit [Phyllobacterium phragmitis]PRD42577.1 ABC transporter permease [Phyllobacterium phragmitis]